MILWKISVTARTKSANVDADVAVNHSPAALPRWRVVRASSGVQQPTTSCSCSTLPKKMLVGRYNYGFGGDGERTELSAAPELSVTSFHLVKEYARIEFAEAADRPATP